MTVHASLAQMLPLKRAARMVHGKGGRPAHVDSLRRWAARGCKLPDGSLVRLKTVKVAGTRYTREDWVADFNALRMLGGMPGA